LLNRTLTMIDTYGKCYLICISGILGSTADAICTGSTTVLCSTKEIKNYYNITS
jgi:hypothetical protein